MTTVHEDSNDKTKLPVKFPRRSVSLVFFLLPNSLSKFTIDVHVTLLKLPLHTCAQCVYVFVGFFNL